MTDAQRIANLESRVDGLAALVQLLIEREPTINTVPRSHGARGLTEIMEAQA